MLTINEKKSVFERANNACQAGQFWRAKEILSGNISTQKFNPELYHRYGELLLKMGDKVEAGKYLFLSGVRDPEHEEAINLFVKRYSKKNSLNLLYAFPTRAQFCSIDKYPEATRKELETLGFPKEWSRHELVVNPKSTKQKLGNYVAFTGIGCLLICLIVGFITIGWTVFNWVKQLIP